ncbi:MAG: HIT family protein [Polyangiaceae bacterium]
MSSARCVFCDIASGGAPAAIVARGPEWMAFLDLRPVFPGHVLVIPTVHRETLLDLGDDEVAKIFVASRNIASAVTRGLGCQGTFVAMNNRVSQSVPHLHVHVVPRTKGDGLRGFFWPRSKYASDSELERHRALIAAAYEPAARV